MRPVEAEGGEVSKAEDRRPVIAKTSAALAKSASMLVPVRIYHHVVGTFVWIAG